MIRILTLVVVVSLARTAAAQGGCWSDAVAVEAKGGQFLSSSALQPADLTAKIDGKPVSISSVEPEGDKTAVVILLDGSGSMVDTSSMEFELARGIVAALPPAQPTMIVAFAEHSAVVASDRAETAKWLQTITGLKKGQRRTALWDAIDKTVSTISSPHPIFIVLSDGEDNLSKVHADVVMRKLQQSDVRMIWVEIRSDRPMTEEETQAAEEIAHIAATTGGFAIRSAHEFSRSSYIGQAKLAADAVGAYYHVRFDLPLDVPGTDKLKIGLASNKRELKGAHLVYRERLHECSSQPASH